MKKQMIGIFFLIITMCLSACNYEADRYIIDVEDLKTESITARESYAVQEEDAIHEEPVPIEEVLAQNATSYNGQSLQYEYVLSDGKILRIDAAVCVSDIEEIHKYQYILNEPKENDNFSDKLLHAVFGERALEMEYEEGYPILILRNSSNGGDYYMYSVYTPMSGATVWGEQGYMLEYRKVNLYPFEDNLLDSVSESRAKMTAEGAVELCSETLDAVQDGQQYMMDYVMAYGNQGRTPFYWLVYKRVLDEMVVNAYNDLTFYVDDNGIEKIYGAVYDAQIIETPEKMLTPEEACDILSENIDIVNAQNQFDFSGNDVVNISQISLEYTVVQAMNGEVYITPTWRFCFGSTDDERNNLREKIFAVDVFTGDIIQEERGHNF